MSAVLSDSVLPVHCRPVVASLCEVLRSKLQLSSRVWAEFCHLSSHSTPEDLNSSQGQREGHSSLQWALLHGHHQSLSYHLMARYDVCAHAHMHPVRLSGFLTP